MASAYALCCTDGPAMMSFGETIARMIGLRGVPNRTVFALQKPNTGMSFDGLLISRRQSSL